MKLHASGEDYLETVVLLSQQKPDDTIGNLGTIDYKTADSKEIIASYER